MHSKNILVAKKCGWVSEQLRSGTVWKNALFSPRFDGPPDYCNDLNAIKWAVERYCDNSIDGAEYGRWLVKIVLGYDFWIMSTRNQVLNHWEITRLSNASAEQRVEAFIKTFKLDLYES